MFDELRPLVTQDQQLVDFCGRKVLCSIKLKASSTVQHAQSHSVHPPQSLPTYTRGLDICHVNTRFYLCLSTFGGTGSKKTGFPRNSIPQPT